MCVQGTPHLILDHGEGGGISGCHGSGSGRGRAPQELRFLSYFRRPGRLAFLLSDITVRPRPMGA